MEKSDFDALKVEARTADLARYFESCGYKVKRYGHEAKVEMGEGHSFFINTETNGWYDHYNGDYGSNSIDCLTKVLGYSFNQAVYELTGKEITGKRSEEYPKEQAPDYTYPKFPKTVQTEKKELKMPETAEKMARVFAYLHKSRGIPNEVIQQFAHAKLLYQSKDYGNAVFVHKDDSGNVIGGEIQGTTTFKRYKGIAPGTGDSVFKFMPFPTPDGKPKKAFIFESAIDLMSFYSMWWRQEKKPQLTGCMFISMAGLKPSIPKQLQENGVEIVSCVDNDDAGRKFESENGFKRSAWVKSKLDEKGIKDWNELLICPDSDPSQGKIQTVSEHKEQQKQDERKLERPNPYFSRR